MRFLRNLREMILMNIFLNYIFKHSIFEIKQKKKQLIERGTLLTKNNKGYNSSLTLTYCRSNYQNS